MALDVPPSTTGFDAGNSLLANAERFCNFPLRAGRGAYCEHIFGREFRHRIGFAAKLSALGDFVGNIVSIRSKKQMLRVNTCSIVALMTDVQTGWDWTFVKLVRKPMSVDGAAIVPKRSVPGLKLRGRPFPTGRLANLDIRKNPINRRGHANLVGCI